MNFITQERFEHLVKKLRTSGPIMVLGDLGIDKYTLGNVNRISPEAPVPVLQVTEEKFKLGLSANISNNLNSLEIESTLCGVVGEDKYADLLENLLEDRGLKTWGLVRDLSRKTTFKERVTAGVQQICRIDYETTGPIKDKLEERLIDRYEELLMGQNALILEDYCKGTLTERVIYNAIRDFKSKGKLVTVDPGLNTPPRFYKGAGLLKPNFKEAKSMVKAMGYMAEDLNSVAKILVEELELDMLVITLGPEGMALIDNINRPGELIKIPTLASSVFDVSGAGDTAIALLTATLLAGGTLEEAAWISNCGSGVVVGKIGTATVSLDELRDFYLKISKKIHQRPSEFNHLNNNR
jgi:rfaE bifunctional protein kinase chain/domain